MVGNKMNTKNTQAQEAKYSTLSAFARANKEDATRRDDFWLSPSRIEIEAGYNVRGAGMDSGEYWEQPEVIEHIEKLAQAYERGDAIPPIKGKFDKETQTLKIRDGEHRYRGLMIAISRGAEIPKVRVEEVSGDEINQQVVMLTSSETRPLTPIERAELYVRLYNRGLGYDQIALKVSTSTAHVKQYIEEVYNLPFELKRQIAMGKLTVNKALTPVAKLEKAKIMKSNKATVKKVFETLLQVKSDQVEIVDGKANIQIPAELWEQILKIQTTDHLDREEEFKQNQVDLPLGEDEVEAV